MSADLASALLALHHGPGFVIPNAWDAGSARILAQAGFPAIATTSAGIAWSYGLTDGGGTGAERMLQRIAEIVDAVDVPVTADLEDGYGSNPAEVAVTIGRALEAGAVGANLEDAADGRLFDAELAAEKIAAAREAAPRGTFVINARTDAYFAPNSHVEDPFAESVARAQRYIDAGLAAEKIAAAREAAPRGTFVINARTDAYFAPNSHVEDPFAETVARAQRYVDAGADCVFVPGVDDAESIRRLASEIPAPLNIVAGLAPTLIDAPTLFSLGVKRVSIGGGLARAALAFVERAGRELREAGTLGFLDGALRYAEVQERFR